MEVDNSNQIRDNKIILFAMQLIIKLYLIENKEVTLLV